MPSRSVISRRTVLRGIGGTTVALPALEAMFNANGTAYAADGSAPPKRYVVAYAGCSIGSGAPRGYDPTSEAPPEFVPSNVGADYDLKLALQPLDGGPAFKVGGAEYKSVKNEVSVISGLRVPYAPMESAPLEAPPATRITDHDSAPIVLGATHQHGGESSDQIVARSIAEKSKIKILNYMVQASRYRVDSQGPYDGGISVLKGKNASDPAVVKPRQAWNALFSGFVPPSDPVEAKRLQELRLERQSVVDLVRDSTLRLLPRLGTTDRQRLGQHLDEIRDLERRIATQPLPGPACALPLEPKDFPVNGNYLVDPYPYNVRDPKGGYSNEEERAQIMVDLIHLAFACDMSRVAALGLTSMNQSPMNFAPLIGEENLDGVEYTLHALTHGANGIARQRPLALGIAWHVKHFARLIAKLRGTSVGGSNLLDHAALVLLFEAGWGDDGGRPGKVPGNDWTPHSTENMALLVAGRAGGHLKLGQHIVAEGKHPGNVVREVMTAVGVPGTTFNEVEGGLPQLVA